ncbi:MAG: carboxypeptidase-like regulatory domain-containing protein [Lachnospiraceae bacterium]|nr:carboxypeptidase-like regulatory domain-containing protein [Lachnospiraceae bacterium]
MENTNKENGITDPGKKRAKDQFYVVLMGLIGYGLILIAIVIGTFFIVKNTFKKKDEEVAKAIEAVNINSNGNESAKDEIVSDIGEGEEASSKNDVAATNDPENKKNEHGADISEYTDAEGNIDYSIMLFKPGQRDKELKWKDSVFSRIENVKAPESAVVNQYVRQRKFCGLTEDKKLELCIYSNPGDKNIEKITAIEYGSGPMGIIDYYYDNGNINYIAERAAAIDEPIDISSGKITSRYYFDNDTLVKYSYCEDNKATVFNVASLDDYSEGTVDQYEYLEEKMVNKAYITYNAAIAIEEVQVIDGYIFDEYEQPLTDITVKIYDSVSMKEVADTLSDGDGHYNLSVPVNENEKYVLSAYKDSLDEVRVYDLTAESGSGTLFVPTIRMTYSDDGAEYNVQIVVRDSIDNLLPIADASIRLRSGLNCEEGDVVASSVLDATGAAMFTIQSGNYTAEVSKGGYENSFFNVYVTANRLTTVGYAVKDVPDDETQIILAWDTTPLDLDARLITAGGVNVLRGQQDSVGSLTTETISVKLDDGNFYRYYVSDYSDFMGGDANSANMTLSGARVYIYTNEGLIRSFSVPMGHLGVVWEAFDIRNGKIIPVNHYYNAIETDSYWMIK